MPEFGVYAILLCVSLHCKIINNAIIRLQVLLNTQMTAKSMWQRTVCNSVNLLKGVDLWDRWIFFR